MEAARIAATKIPRPNTTCCGWPRWISGRSRDKQPSFCSISGTLLWCVCKSNTSPTFKRVVPTGVCNLSLCREIANRLAP